MYTAIHNLVCVLTYNWSFVLCDFIQLLESLSQFRNPCYKTFDTQTHTNTYTHTHKYHTFTHAHTHTQTMHIDRQRDMNKAFKLKKNMEVIKNLGVDPIQWKK